MTSVAHHAALALAVVSLVAAGLRVASLAVPHGLVRAIAAVIIAAAAAILEALGLALVSLGGSTLALAAAAVATAAAAHAALPTPTVPAAAELARHVRSLRLLERVVLGAIGGAWVAWTVWLAAHPAMGRDMVVYHLPEAVTWVHSGRPGSVVSVLASIPTGNYPLTHEVLLEWGMAIGRSFAWPVLVTATVPVLIGASAWAGLRAVGAGKVTAALGAAALVCTPAVLASQRGGSAVDPAALCFLVSAGALVAAARRWPAAAAPAVVAAGLAVGSKPSTVPIACVLVILALLAARPELRRLAVPLGLAAAVAVAVGLVWYIRDLVAHGSPLWPLQATPWGDARPPFVELTATRFLDRPGEALSRLWPYYRADFGGPLILLGAALPAAVLARRRAVHAAAALTVVCVLGWMAAPYTGLPSVPAPDLWASSATRFLLPAVASAVLAIALASRRPGLRFAAPGVLAAAAGVGLVQTFRLGFPSAPSPLLPLVGAVAGAAVSVPGLRAPRSSRVAAAAVVAGLAAIATATADGFVERHARALLREGSVPAWFAGRADWRDGRAPIVSTFSLYAPLAGDRLQHVLILTSPRVACQRAASAHAWLVLDNAAQRAAHAPGCGGHVYLVGLTTVYPP